MIVLDVRQTILGLPESFPDLLNPHQTITLHHSQWEVNFVGRMNHLAHKNEIRNGPSLPTVHQYFWWMVADWLIDPWVMFRVFFFLVALRPNSGPWSSLTELRDYTHFTHHTRWDSFWWDISPSQRPLPDNTQHWHETEIRAPGGNGTRSSSKGYAGDICHCPRGHLDQHLFRVTTSKMLRSAENKILD